MGASVHRARVRWSGGDREDIRAHTIGLAGQGLAASSAPEFGFASEIDAEKVLSLHHRAHERCFIANSVSCPVEVEPQQ